MKVTIDLGHVFIEHGDEKNIGGMLASDIEAFAREKLVEMRAKMSVIEHPYQVRGDRRD
jgi:hypothetical protein